MASNDMVAAARAWAEQAHRGQVRDGPDAEPYINHPMRVSHRAVDLLRMERERDASLLAVDEGDIAIAAVLHDVLEDCPDPISNYATIAARYGARVAAWVDLLSKPYREGDADKATNTERYLTRLREFATKPVLIIKAADREDNLRSLTSSGWDLPRRTKYLSDTAKYIEILAAAKLTRCVDALGTAIIDGCRVPEPS